MRRLYAFLFLLAILSFGTFSCQKVDPAGADAECALSDSPGYTELMQAISRYDSSYAPESVVKTRGKVWRAICKCFRVVAADIEGAVAGAREGDGFWEKVALGVAGGISSSADAAEREFAPGVESVNAAGVVNRRLEIKDAFYGSEVTGCEVGKLHNVVMKELYSNYCALGREQAGEGQNFDNVVSILLRKKPIEGFELIEHRKLDNLKRKVDEIVDAYVGLDDREAYKRLKNSSIAGKEEMAVISNYAMRVAAIEDRAKRSAYAKGFSKIVKESSISDDAKANILIGTSMAINSLELWEE